jgi:MarR family 2-MHQ and catechol resistance regulon transcriptional repressor
MEPVVKITYRGTKAETEALNAYVKLMRVAETLMVASQRDFAKGKLTVSQFGVLEALYHLGPMCQRDAAKKILKSSANITTVVDNLEKRGLVERHRSSEDRRYIALHLTDEGRNLIGRIFPSHVQGIVKNLSALTTEEQHQLAHLCKKLGMANTT